MNSGEYVRKCQKRKKKFAVDAFGGKCQVCGYNKCLGALGFHHVYGEKKHEPSYVIGRWSWERAKEELDKCVLICLNCHAEIHYDDGLDITRFELKPWLSKECPTCKTQFDTKEEKRIYCSESCYKFSLRVTERPSKETLLKLIQEKPFTTIGKMFEVSDNAIRKWCKGYELPYKLKDVKELKGSVPERSIGADS